MCLSASSCQSREAKLDRCLSPGQSKRSGPPKRVSGTQQLTALDKVLLANDLLHGLADLFVDDLW